MIRVGVVRGGTGNHYEESLASGAFVLANLPKDKYQAIDIFIDKNGVWHINGLPASHTALKTKVDVVWNSLHGFYGEDGKLTQLLENMSIPHTGSNMLSSAILANNKLAKEHFLGLGVKTQRALYVEDWGSVEASIVAKEITKKVFSKFSPPWKVAPISKISGMDSVLCKTQNDLTGVLTEMGESRIPVMIEEVVLGRDAEIVVMPGFRKQEEYTLLPLDSSFFKSKLNYKEKNVIENLAKKVHKDLHLGAFSRMRACITKKGELYLCGIDTLPNMHPVSSIHHSLSEVGSSFGEFAEHMIDSALRD